MTELPLSLFASGMQAASLLMALYGLLLLFDQWRVGRWPRVRGRVFRARWHPEAKEHDYRGMKYWSYERISDFAYRFHVDGVEYVGRVVHHPVWIGQGRSGKVSEVENYLDKHKSRREIEVIYNPSNPADCLLEPSRGLFPYALIGIGLLAFLGAVSISSGAPLLTIPAAG